MERMSCDNLQTIPSINRSPPRSPFLATLLRRQSKNDHSQIRFKEQRRSVVLGAAKVGKSSIIQQFLYDQFPKRYNRTIEDLHVAEYNLSSGASLTLEILDTTGSYQFPAMRALSISNGNAFLLVYSVDDEDSWKQIAELRHQIIYTRGPDVPIVIAGNKSDEDVIERSVPREMVEKTVKRWRCGYIECKLKGNNNIVDVFEKSIYLIAQLLVDESLEDGEGELYDDDGDPDIPKALLGRYEPPGGQQYEEESGSYEDPPPMYYTTKDLTRGAFPRAPPAPPIPKYGSYDDDLYDKNFALLEKNLKYEVPNGFVGGEMIPVRGPPYYGPPPHRIEGRRRTGKEVKHTALQRAFIQKKRGEAAKADNVYEKSRVAAEVGQVTRNNRQCRTLFNECPVSTIARPIATAASETIEEAPFISRAVNNIRRVLLGSTSGSTSKTKRVNEIKEVIQQLQPVVGTNRGSSEVKVVLNIGPSHPAQVYTGQDLHRTGGIPSAAPIPPHYPPDKIPQQNIPLPQSNIPHSQMGPILPTAFGSQLKYVPTKATTKRPITTSKPAIKPTKKTIFYRNPASSPASKKPLPTPSSSALVFDDLEDLLKTTLPPDFEEEPSTDNPNQATVPVNTFSDIIEPSEQTDQYVEDDFALPTKYPMSKEEYAQNLRETFQIFDRFKEAHRNPVIPRTTVKPKKTAASVTTRKPATPQKAVNTKDNSNHTKKLGTLDKGEQADLEIEEHPDKEGQDDLNGIIKWFQNWRDRRKKDRKKKGKKGKGKGKKKHKPDTSEESSEEDHANYHRHPALVAVPPPELQKIHWRSGMTLVKDGVYHMLFGNRVARPLPPKEVQYHEDSEEETEHGKKLTRHDYQFYEHPHHDLPQHDLSQDEGTSPFHRLRTSESVEEDILPPPQLKQNKTVTPNILIKTKTQVTKKSQSAVNATSTTAAPGTTKIVIKNPGKIKAKIPRPIFRPDPEPPSDEDENEEDDNNDHGPHLPILPMPRPPPLPPARFENWDSRSFENSYEEDDMNNRFQRRPLNPHMVFSPFSIVQNGNKMKMQSNGPVTFNRVMNNFGKNTKNNGKSSKVNNSSGNRNKSSSPGSGNRGSSSSQSTTKLGIMTKAKGIPTTTVKPKRKILKYKNG